MCALGSKGCVLGRQGRKSAKGGRARKNVEKGSVKGKGCGCWEARDVCVLGSHKGRARERGRQQGMYVCGSRARDGQGSKALKGEVVQGMRVWTLREVK